MDGSSDVAAQNAEQQRKFYEFKRYYEDDGYPRCTYCCIIGNVELGGLGGTRCVCDGIEGHAEPHERIPIFGKATAEDVAAGLPVFESFVQ